MNHEIKFKIIELLKGRGAYHVSVNGKQHYTRCPFCGDSRNLNHSHLSIVIDIDSDLPMMYRCLKCSVSGLLTNTTLEELDLYIDQDMKTELRAFNKKSMRIGKLVNLNMENYSVPLYQSDYLIDSKLDYINQRLGTSFDYEKAHQRKIILDFFQFMKFNDLKSIHGLDFSMMRLLNQDYVGFLSTNNNCIIFRDITGKNKYRYFKVIINDKNVNQDSFYSIPNSIPLLYTDDVHVHIAEGIFDILSIQENVKKTLDLNYYYASCGFGSISIMKYLIHHGMNTGINLHIYSDNDKRDYDHNRYMKKNKEMLHWIDHIYIHRNQYEGEKDYGVPMDKIIDSNRKLK